MPKGAPRAPGRHGSANLHGGQGAHDLDSFEADGDDLGDEAEDVLGLVRAVGVVGDAAAFVGADLILVNDLIEGGVVAETVFASLGRGIPLDSTCS